LRESTDHLWLAFRQLTRLHTLLYRASGGRVGHRFRGGPPMLLLDHVGARSAVKRTTPLVYLRDGENIVLIASKGGHPRHPAWFHNLRAHPETTVQLGSERLAVRARVADAGERARLWPKAVAIYAGYETYQQRTEREIPLVILEPR
jgi:deazaflavin-dependent oxidoreductase (nitroreductase family)